MFGTYWRVATVSKLYPDFFLKKNPGTHLGSVLPIPGYLAKIGVSVQHSIHYDTNAHTTPSFHSTH